MIEKAVCNASPLIFLAKIKKLNLLESYTLYVPIQVKAEIQKGFANKKENTGQIIEFIGSNNIEAARVALLKNLPDSLGSGEKAVISLALKMGIKRVLIDEAKARLVARFKGLYPRGTLGILWNAFKDGTIDRKTLELSVFDLIQGGYRIKEEILAEFLKRLRE